MKTRTFTCGVGLTALLCAPGLVSAQSPDTVRPLPATIPIFPLQDATLFPNASYSFYIFEPRYRAMIADALKGDRIVGMVMLQPGHEAEYEGRPPIFAIGCAGLITAYEELPGGEYNIVLRGIAKFRVTGEDNSRLYRLARVVTVPEDLDAQERAALSKERQRIEALMSELSLRFGIAEPPPGVPDAEVVDRLAQHLPMERPERQRLLERDDALARARPIIEVLEQILKAP